MFEQKLNRRHFERFAVQPMYSEIAVDRVLEGRMRRVEGHVYDVSEGGLRVELDERLDVGEHVNVSFVLPGQSRDDADAAIHAACQVVWVNDDLDDPAAARHALRVTAYQGERSRQRLLHCLSSGSFRRAA